MSAMLLLGAGGRLRGHAVRAVGGAAGPGARRRNLAALSRGVGGEKVVAAGLARLLQQVRDIGQPMAADIGLTSQLEGLLEGVTEAEVTPRAVAAAAAAALPRVPLTARCAGTHAVWWVCRWVGGCFRPTLSSASCWRSAKR